MTPIGALPPGHYCPRIFRPGFNLVPPQQGEAFAGTGTTLQMATADLHDLLQVVEPAQATFGTYGHRIRQQLLFACTEVENAMAGVLRSNHYRVGDRYTTNDYVKLLDPMLLDKYRVRLRHSPALCDFSPFQGWDPAAATKSLPWYHAYNLTKHDREAHLALATLEHLLSAVGAMLVLGAAQFGSLHYNPGGAYYQDLLAFTFEPALRLDDYTPPRGNEGRTAVDYPFV